MRLCYALIFAILAVCGADPIKFNIVPIGKEYTYSFKTDVLVGTKEPTDFGSRYSYTGKLQIAGITDTLIQFALTDVKYALENGQIKPKNKVADAPIPAEASSLTLPFQVTYDASGRLVSIRTDPKDMEWSVNMKKSIASNFEIGTIRNLDEKNTFAIVAEENIYGKCNVNYQLLTREKDEISMVKTMDPSTCKNNLQMDEEKDFLSMDNGKMYVLMNMNGMFAIKTIRGEGGVIVHPKGIRNQNAFVSSRQFYDFIKESDSTVTAPKEEGVLHTSYKYMDPLEKCRDVPLQTAVDVTGGRNKIDSEALIKKVDSSLEKIMQYFDENHITMMKPDMKNINLINQILFELETANLDVLEQMFVILTEKSKTETERRKLNIFTELLPYIGTRPSAILVRNLVRKNKIEDNTAVRRMLGNLPEQILCPTEKLLAELKDLLELQTKDETLPQVAALSYASLVKYTFEDVDEKSVALENYISMFAEKYTNAKDFAQKLLYLECLGNIEIGSVLKRLLAFLEEEKNTALRIKILSLSINRLYEDEGLMVRTVWPILTNRKENTQVRLMAYLIYTMQKVPTVNHFMNLFWLMRHEPNEMIYAFHYNIMESLSKPSDMYENSKALADVCKLVMRISRKPMIQLKEGLTVIETASKANGMGIRADILTLPDGHGNTQYGMSINRKFNTEVTEVLSVYSYSSNDSTYLSIHKQERCIKIISLSTLDPEEVLVDVLSTMSASFKGKDDNFVESVMLPLSAEKIIPNEIGAPIKLYDRMSVLLQLKFSFEKMENFEIDLHIRSVQSISMGMKTYNPLANVWHGIQELKTMAVNIPIDVRMGQPSETGLTVSMKTNTGADSIIGAQLYGESQVFVENLMSKTDRELLAVGEVSDMYVKIGRENVKPINKVIMDEELKEIAKQLKINVFECDRDITFPTLHKSDIFDLEKKTSMIHNIFKHKSRVWDEPGMKSCGIAYQLIPMKDIDRLEFAATYSTKEGEGANETMTYEFKTISTSNATISHKKLILSKPARPWPSNTDEAMAIFGEFSTESNYKLPFTVKVTMGSTQFKVLFDFEVPEDSTVNHYQYEMTSMRSDEQDKTKHIMSNQCKPEYYVQNQLMPLTKNCYMTETAFRKYVMKFKGTGPNDKTVETEGVLTFPLLRTNDWEFKIENTEIFDTIPDFLQEPLESMIPPVNIFFGIEAFDWAWSRKSCIVRPMFMMRNNMMRESVSMPKEWTSYFKKLDTNTTETFEVFGKMGELKDSVAFRIVHGEETIECEPRVDGCECKLDGKVLSDPKYASIRSKSMKRMTTSNPPIMLVDVQGLLVVYDAHTIRIETSSYMRVAWRENLEVSGMCMEKKS